jgi:hypothetical protein
VQRTTGSGEHAFCNVQRTACSGQRAADIVKQILMQPATRRRPTDLSVEVTPVAVTCVREVMRRAEGTSSFFLAAPACAIPTPRAARACVRAWTPPKQAACSGQPTTGRLELQHATNRTCQSHRSARGGAIMRGLAHRRIRKQTEHTRRAAGDVPQTTCRRHHAGRQRAAETEQRKPSSTSHA